jgi:lysozyme
MIQGIDVSSYQGNIDWAGVKKAGYAFAFIKASEGVGLTDRHFTANWRESRAEGLITAAYHFYRPGEDPTVQARHFLAVAPLAAGDLPPICDVEKAGASSPARYGKDLRTWLSVVEAATGLKPIVYTSPGLWNHLVSGDFSAWPLWVAH